MKYLLVVGLVAALAAPSLAKVTCPKSCSEVDCSSAPTEETCKGKIEPNSSLCGCCNTCVVSVGYLGKCEQFEAGVSTVRYQCPSMSVCFNNRCVALP